MTSHFRDLTLTSTSMGDSWRIHFYEYRLFVFRKEQPLWCYASLLSSGTPSGESSRKIPICVLIHCLDTFACLRKSSFSFLNRWNTSIRTPSQKPARHWPKFTWKKTRFLFSFAAHFFSLLYSLLMCAGRFVLSSPCISDEYKKEQTNMKKSIQI